jgi:hypothetical protein
MLELKEKPICCGNEMRHDTCCQSMVHTNEADIQEWVCLTCGKYIQLVEDIMDEEELLNVLENG